MTVKMKKSLVLENSINIADSVCTETKLENTYNKYYVLIDLME